MKLSEATRRRMSEVHRIRCADPEVRIRLSQIQLGLAAKRKGMHAQDPLEVAIFGRREP